VQAEAEPRGTSTPQETGLEAKEVHVEELYRRCGEAGLRYGPAFRGLLRLAAGKDEAWGEVQLPEDVDWGGAWLHPALLDACFQVAAGAMGDRLEMGWLPFRVERYRLESVPAPSDRLHVHARISAEETTLAANIFVLNEGWQRIALIEKLFFAATRGGILQDWGKESAKTDSGVDLAIQEILRRPPDQRRDLLREYLHVRLAQIMGLSVEEIPEEKSLDSLGMDSLMAFELRDEVERTLKVTVPMEAFLQDLSLIDFTELLLRKLDADEAVAEEGVRDEADSDIPPADERWIEGTI
jgi:acyl carrier protein